MSAVSANAVLMKRDAINLLSMFVERGQLQIVLNGHVLLPVSTSHATASDNVPDFTETTNIDVVDDDDEESGSEDMLQSTRALVLVNRCHKTQSRLLCCV